jgi:LmbE family N-acetylglucosaminyl deacetylase
VGEISKVITAIKPETIVIPFRHDAHSDHRITYEALMPFMKSFRYPFIKNVMTMETLSETGYAVSDAREAFVPNFFVDISKTLSEKVSIMKEYDGELGIHPFPRSEIGIQAQAQLRGSFINTEYAEAFHLLKSIES